jgi:hypothetical protein
MTPPFGPEWTTPKPARLPRGERSLEGWRAGAGVGMATVGHLIAWAVTVIVGGYWRGPDGSLTPLYFTEITVFALCLVAGIVALVRGERSLGTGLLAGWAGGAVALPLIAYVGWIVVTSIWGFD